MWKYHPCVHTILIPHFYLPTCGSEDPHCVLLWPWLRHRGPLKRLRHTVKEPHDAARGRVVQLRKRAIACLADSVGFVGRCCRDGGWMGERVSDIPLILEFMPPLFPPPPPPPSSKTGRAERLFRNGSYRNLHQTD